MSTAPITRFRDEYRFLSNFWPAPGGVEWQGLRGPTVEHVYQAAKTLDPRAQERVLGARTPGRAKRIGQMLVVRDDWDEIKLGVMAELTRQKYADPELAALLLATGDAVLIEGNGWCDHFWGESPCEEHGGGGENWLGRLLMVARAGLSNPGTDPSTEVAEPALAATRRRSRLLAYLRRSARGWRGAARAAREAVHRATAPSRR